MNNSTLPANECDYCYVDLSKAELPIILIPTLIFNFIAVLILFKIRKKSEEINHYIVSKVAMNDLLSSTIFIVMWIGGWIKCGCLMSLTSCSILGWMATTTVIWSGWIVVIMAGCRYFATVKPIYYRSHVTKLKVKVTIYGTLVLTGLQIIFPFTGLVEPYLYYEDNFICAYNFSPSVSGKAHSVILGILAMEGLVASAATMFFNLSIIYELRRKNVVFINDIQKTMNKPSTSASASANYKLREDNKIAFANVTIVVSAVFCICYLPFLIRVMYDVTTNVESQDEFYHSITMSLLFLAPLLNPIVYVICNKRYRSYVTHLLKSLCRKPCRKRSNKIDFAVSNTNTTVTNDTVTTFM